MLEVLGHLVALLVQLLDGGTELGNGRRDVRKLDDVGIRIFGVLAQFGQGIRNPLIFFKIIREVRQNTRRERDVAGFEFNTSRLGIGFQDGKKRPCCEGWGLVGQCVDNLGFG